MLTGAAPTALGIIGINTQPYRAGLTFGHGPPGLDEGKRSTVPLLTRPLRDSILSRLLPVQVLNLVPSGTDLSASESEPTAWRQDSKHTWRRIGEVHCLECVPGGCHGFNCHQHTASGGKRKSSQIDGDPVWVDAQRS
jgi:hypothetical protein